jgi:hypothetical protein
VLFVGEFIPVTCKGLSLILSLNTFVRNTKHCNCRLLVFTVIYQAKKAIGHVTIFVPVHDPLQVKIHWFNKLELLWFQNSHRCLIAYGVMR